MSHCRQRIGCTRSFFWLALLGLELSCGARDIGTADGLGVPISPSGGHEVLRGAPCNVAADCDGGNKCAPFACSVGQCLPLAPVVCDDKDPCTLNQCNPVDGQCQFPPKALDADGDGVRGPLPGKKAGAPDACGTDCDDLHAAVYPGAKDVCDGLDNDCNGTIDDGASYVNAQREVLISGDSKRAGLGGLTFDGSHFVVSMARELERNLPELVGLKADGTEAFRQAITKTNSDAYAGGVRSGGFGLASAWEDRRDDDFEVYFNLFDAAGKKLGPDVRVSNAPGFSLGPDVLAQADAFSVAWQDRRNGQDFRIFAQRILLNGAFETKTNLELTPDIAGAESPSLAEGDSEVGMVFNVDSGASAGLEVQFRTFSHKLDKPSQVAVVGPGVSPQLHFMGGKYYAFWYQYDKVPGDAIWGAVLNPDGTFAVSPKRVTPQVAYARGAAALSFGDRFVLTWAQSQGRAGDVYDLFTQTLDLKLNTQGSATQITAGKGDTLGPAVALGLGGQLGLAYTRYEGGGVSVWFNTLSCTQ